MKLATAYQHVATAAKLMNFPLQMLAPSLEVFYGLLKSFPFAYCWYKHAIDCRILYGFRFNLEDVFQNIIHRRAITAPEYSSLKHLHLFLGSCNCRECLPAGASSFWVGDNLQRLLRNNPEADCSSAMYSEVPLVRKIQSIAGQHSHLLYLPPLFCCCCLLYCFLQLFFPLALDFSLILFYSFGFVLIATLNGRQ